MFNSKAQSLALAMALLLAAGAQRASAETRPATGNLLPKPLLSMTPLDPAAARERGLERREFNFGDKALSFTSYLPAAAKIETATIDTSEPLTGIGRIRIVGKIAFPDTPQVEATITAFQLASVANPARICAHQAEQIGYSVAASATTSDLAQAQVLAFATRDGRRMQGAFGQCYARGDRLLSVYVLIDLRDAKDNDAARTILNRARDLASPIVANLAFADEQPSGFRDGLGEAKLRDLGRDLVLAFPKSWQVAINDFTGHLPAELHLTRTSGDKSRGALWLAAQERAEQPDLDKLGPALIADYFAQQSKDAQAPVLLVAAEDPLFGNAGIAARSFRFSLKDKAGKDAGDILAILLWHKNRLYAVSLWLPWPASADANIFYSRLPGLTAYDMMATRLRAHLLE
ncbi:hypothetical protein ACQKLX_18300 [Bosea sp. NPDC003192]|uniref:hypothetical protein n=1 Tax=Bosea sp. NPDC003192 TaxID=3390551 RepID=UPI003CFE025F